MGSKKLPIRRRVDKETRSNSLSSSSTKDPIQDISDNFLDGENFTSVNVKSCGNSFKTCPSNDATTAVAVAKLVDAGGEYHPYQQVFLDSRKIFICLRKTFSSNFCHYRC